MTGHRLFVALALPRAARDALRGVMGGIAEARWQNDNQLHCTIRFLGDVDARTADDVVGVLAAVRHPPIDAAFGEAGAFERAGRIDTLWVGVTPAEPMRTLHAKVGHALRRAGIQADARPYKPHVTIARFARRASPHPAVAAAIAVPRVTFELSQMRLYESHLLSDGARYEVIEAYALA